MVTELPKKVVLVDIETSSLFINRGARVIEVAALAVDGLEVTATMHEVINVKCWLDPKASAVHGLTYRDINKGTLAYDVWRKFEAFMAGRVIVAHNAEFDKRYLYNEFNQFELIIPNDFICTMRLAKSLLPGLGSYKLRELYHHLTGKEVEFQHRAMTDVNGLYEVWKKLTEISREHAAEPVVVVDGHVGGLRR
jgi:DNA polymerase III epsilon subunit-like protein